MVARVREALRTGAVARGIRRARLGRIGRPIEGYLHVDVDDAELRDAMGIEAVSSIPTRSSRRGGRSRTSGSATLDAEVVRDWTFEGDVDEAGSLERSLRAALALQDVVDRHASTAARSTATCRSSASATRSGSRPAGRSGG